MNVIIVINIMVIIVVIDIISIRIIHLSRQIFVPRRYLLPQSFRIVLKGIKKQANILDRYELSRVGTVL